MRVLVTGGSGYVGSHAVRELARAGHDLVIYDNLSTGHLALSQGFEVVVGDLADRDKLSSCLDGVDLVMHFAASAYVGESVLNPRKYFANNVEAALQLMDCLLQSGIHKFVFSSSCAVYGAPSALPIVEESYKQPVNPYGDTKLFFERVLAAYARTHGLKYVALRYFNAAGASFDGTIGECHTPETHIIPLALRAATRKTPPLHLLGKNLPTPDGTCIRDFVHVEDLGRAHVLAANYLNGGGDSVTLNLGTGRGTSLAQLLKEIEMVTGLDVPHLVMAGRIGDPPVLFSDASKAERVLGWRPKHNLTQIIETAFAWEQHGAPMVMSNERALIADKSKSMSKVLMDNIRTTNHASAESTMASVLRRPLSC